MNSPEATAYDSWAQYYDVADADRTPFIEFYSGLLSPQTRSILELGCGTGRILSELAKRLRSPALGSAEPRLVGVDGSAGMLNVAAAGDASIEWLLGDIRTPPVDGRFDLVFCCFNTLQHLLEDSDVIDAFSAARDRLSDTGRYAFDIYQPNLGYLRTRQVNRLARSFVDGQGRSLEIREDTQYDEASRVLAVQWRLLDPSDPDGSPLAETSYHLRQYPPGEIERMLTLSGLAIEERHGDFDRSAFEPSSRKQVIVTRCG